MGSDPHGEGKFLVEMGRRSVAYREIAVPATRPLPKLPVGISRCI